MVDASSEILTLHAVEVDENGRRAQVGSQRELLKEGL